MTRVVTGFFLYQPLIEADGSVSGIFVQGDDVTERKGAGRDLHETDRRKDERTRGLGIVPPDEHSALGILPRLIT